SRTKWKGVTVLGEESQPNIELIAGLQPDLIIANKMRHEKIYEQLSAIAPTVEAQDLRGYWKENFTLYADALNKKAEGEKLIADFDARIEDFKAKAGSKLNETVSDGALHGRQDARLPHRHVLRHHLRSDRHCPQRDDEEQQGNVRRRNHQGAPAGSRSRPSLLLHL
ncbi:hypothetical protein BN871_AV_00180, partial [Paenibacillus sp. P22]